MRNFAGLLFLAAMLLFPDSTTAQANACPTSLAQAPNGAIFALQNTPHIWVVEAAMLHWAGDTRALGSRQIRWDISCQMDVPTLQRLPRGDPFLSSGLVKAGDPS